MNLTLTLLGEQHEAEITRKKMKNLRLRLTDAGEILVSAPMRMPAAEIERFVGDHRDWLEKALLRQSEKAPPQMEETLEDGSEIRILGETLTVRLVRSTAERMSVVPERREFRIETRSPDDPAALRRRFDAWWRAQAAALFARTVDRFLPALADRGVRRPEIAVRRMTSRWGSCKVNGQKITLNAYLLRAPLACVEYVVVHELAHFLVPAHNRKFYDIVAGVLPDWASRRALLRRERSC